MFGNMGAILILLRYKHHDDHDDYEGDFVDDYHQNDHDDDLHNDYDHDDHTDHSCGG